MPMFRRLAAFLSRHSTLIVRAAIVVLLLVHAALLVR